MNDLVGKVKRETDFVLPRACKKARSSVRHLKNPSWELGHRSRRCVANAAEYQGTADLGRDTDEQEEDLDEVALALLEMSSPVQKMTTPTRRPTPPPVATLDHPRPINPSPSALQLQSNTLKAVPTIIITSGSSTESGHADSKSNSCDAIETIQSAGQTTSPSSNHGSETVAFRQSRDSIQPTELRHAQTASYPYRRFDPRQGLDASQTAASLPDMTDRGVWASRIGHTVSTGISLPNITQMANKQVTQENSPQTEQPGMRPHPSSPSDVTQQRDVQTQIMLHQVLHRRLDAQGLAAQAGRPVAKSRGGKLIVVPHPTPRSTTPVPSGHMGTQLKMEPRLPARAHSPAGLSQGHKETQQLTLSRVPTLVLSTAQKPASRLASPREAQTPVNPSVNHAKEAQASAHNLEPLSAPSNLNQGITATPLPKGEGDSGEGERQISKVGKSSLSGAGSSSSSGEESSEEDWLPNWSLNLYNALNPTVITTGQSYPIGRSSSQPVEAKAASVGR